MIKNLFETKDIAVFQKWLDEVHNAVILAHVSPDGDAIGSSLALAAFLRGRGVDTTVVMPNAFPDFLSWMAGARDIIRYDIDKEKADELLRTADLVCCLDFNEASRVDIVEESLLASPARKLMLDHHLHPADFCHLVLSYPEASSTAELTYRFIAALGGVQEITKNIAECIYCGMMTDTGGFTYSSNDPEIYLIIYELLKRGIDKDEIYSRVNNTSSESVLRLRGYSLYEKMIVLPEFHTAIITLDRHEMKRFQCQKGDTEGLVNMPLRIGDVKLSIFLKEDTEHNYIKISLRSKGDFPCNKLAARFFGGGGHKNASGGEFRGTMDGAMLQLKKALVSFEDELNR